MFCRIWGIVEVDRRNKGSREGCLAYFESLMQGALLHGGKKKRERG
jgi:hypothetical protein